MATHPEGFPEFTKPVEVDLEAEEAAAEHGHHKETPYFPIGEVVRLWKGRGGGREDVRMDTAGVAEGSQWRVANYDGEKELYTVEFLGKGNGKMEVTEEQLKKYNPEREARIKKAMEKPPGDTVN